MYSPEGLFDKSGFVAGAGYLHGDKSELSLHPLSVQALLFQTPQLDRLIFLIFLIILLTPPSFYLSPLRYAKAVVPSTRQTL